jgi:hypothetical protein
MNAFITYDELRKFGKEIDANRLLREASSKEGRRFSCPTPLLMTIFFLGLSVFWKAMGAESMLTKEITS